MKRLPADLPKNLRADSGWSDQQVGALGERHPSPVGITAEQTAPLRAAIAALPETQWQDVARYDLAQVAECRYRPQRWPRTARYSVTRERRENKLQQLYFQYPVFVTHDETSPVDHLLEGHLQHAEMENLLKEHKPGFSLEKLPTQNFHANWAYLLIGQLAFNLVAWFKTWILPLEYHRATLKTIRHQVRNVAGQIVRTAQQFFLILSQEYPYQEVWRFALARLAQLTFG